MLKDRLWLATKLNNYSAVAYSCCVHRFSLLVNIRWTEEDERYSDMQAKAAEAIIIGIFQGT